MLTGWEFLAQTPSPTAPPGCERAWFAAHLAFAVAAALVFAAAAASGWSYLRKFKHLRRKDPDAIAAGGPSLEALNRRVRRLVYAGLALLTGAIATGLVHAFQPGRAGWFHLWQTHPKMLASAVAWLVYGAAVCVARARKFRGRQAAVLSLVGLALMIVILLTSVLVPGR